VQPGNARAKECLEDSREREGFSKPCREELEKMMAARAADFRLDPKLRQLCARDIQARPARGALRSCRAGRPPPSARFRGAPGSKPLGLPGSGRSALARLVSST